MGSSIPIPASQLFALLKVKKKKCFCSFIAFPCIYVCSTVQTCVSSIICTYTKINIFLLCYWIFYGDIMTTDLISLFL